MDKMFDLIMEWKELNENKARYAFAEESFDKDSFVQLVKETVTEILEFRKKALDFDNHADDVKKTMWDFNKLLIQIAIYSLNDMGIDESEKYICSVSQAIARLILDHATVSCKVKPFDDTGVLRGDCDECGLYCPGSEYLFSEFWSQTFTYDPNTGDMSELMELARRSIG